MNFILNEDLFADMYCSYFWQLCFGMEVDIHGSSGDEEGLSSLLRGELEISSMEEGELGGSKRFDEQNPGSVLRKGIKFSSTDEFLHFLNEGNNESSLSDAHLPTFLPPL